MLQSALIFGFFLKYLSAYSLCNTADVTGNITIPIRMVLNEKYTPIRLSGSIVIIDGCTVTYIYSFDHDSFLYRILLMSMLDDLNSMEDYLVILKLKHFLMTIFVLMLEKVLKLSNSDLLKVLLFPLEISMNSVYLMLITGY